MSGEKRMLACQATLRHENGKILRRISAVHLSRPENYLSIYQSGCNFSCRKCHSWHFTKTADGRWFSPDDILREATAYDREVTMLEPREKATAWHAHDSCRCCGSCVVYQRRSSTCPGILEPDAIVISPQGFGPARNIAAFTGGDLTCCPEFYGECASLIKAHTRLWVLIETNGYGLTRENLCYLKDSGVDAFWLDIKAYDRDTHRWLTGCENDRILRLPEEMLSLGFVFEVLSLYIPGVVESNDLTQIAELLAGLDPSIPFTLLAFFPEYRMKDYRSPTVEEMVDAYESVRSAGLTRIRLGNLGVFIQNESDWEYLKARVDINAY